MKLIKTALCATVASMAMAGAANAQEFSFNVGAATDYVFRGLDQTGSSEGELFGGVDLAADAFYAGTWFSNVGESGDRALEYDFYAGYKPSLGPVALDLGVIYYGYTESDSGAINSDWNTIEWKAAASVPAGPATLGAALYYSNDVASTDESSLYTEVNVAFTLESGPTISAAYGVFSSDWPGAGLPDSYGTWNIGVTFPFAEKFSFDARYIGADDDAVAFGADFDGVVGTLKAAF